VTAMGSTGFVSSGLTTVCSSTADIGKWTRE
jgi:hypothetical protein